MIPGLNQLISNMERLLALLFLSSCFIFQNARSHNAQEQSSLSQSSTSKLKPEMLEKLLHNGPHVIPVSSLRKYLDIYPSLGSLVQDTYYPEFEKRDIGDREKKEKELAFLLNNLIAELDSDEAKSSSPRHIKSISGEASGEFRRVTDPEPGSKRYGNIFRGPLDNIRRTPPRPRRQRKFRVDPIMFWLGIGK